MFVHLNVHSVFSAMQGTATQEALISRALRCGMHSIALTETNSLRGFIRFVQKCHDAGIRPIAGTHLVTQDDDAILLAENQGGYENISRVLTKRYRDGEKADIRDMLERSFAGIFVLSHSQKTLNKLLPLIPASHLFVELRPGCREKETHRLAKELALEIVATGDVYFLKPEDHQSHRILRAIDRNTTLDRLEPSSVKSRDHWFRAEKDMVSLFPNSLEAMNNSHYLAERCKTDWSFINTVFPGLSLKETHRANRILRQKVMKGAGMRYGTLDDRILKRIDYELALIGQKGFAPYFLVVRDIVKQTKATIGRGSAAASIVSYCLFITQVDPIRHNLIFERFIHPEREDMPDIDVDFPWDERDDILENVFKKYGLNRTAMVSNQVFLRPRYAVREVAKVYGLSNEEIMSITKRIGYHSSRTDLAQWVARSPRFARANLDETLVEVIDQASAVTGCFRNASVHPGGIIIVPDEIARHVPVFMAPKGVQIVEWEKDQVEDSGLLKIDLLGNRSLAVARDTIRQINLYYPSGNRDDRYMDYHQVQPAGDKKTEELMAAGKTMGVFYIESPATRQLLAKAGIVDFEHVVIYSSIIRPAANRFTNLMLERIHGTPWKPLHPDLDFLNESYGIMVYEEQVSVAARVLAGFSHAEAEALRKTMSRDSLYHLLPSWKKKFFAGARRRGYDERITEKVWDMIRSFEGYSFCKPHSASYAMLSFTCAYLKAHYPAEFLAAVISNQGGFYSTYAYLSEARRFGITILPPNINRSHMEYRGRREQIRMGFMSIKKLQQGTVETILQERKVWNFDSLADFLSRVDPPLSDAMALVNSGALSSLEEKMTHRQIAYITAHSCLSGGKPGSPGPDISSPLTSDEGHRLEIETFGFPISSHPLGPYRYFLEGRVRKANEIPKLKGKSVYLAGVYITRKSTQTRQRDAMSFLTLEDETDIFECVLFPEVYAKYGDLLLWETLLILRGKVEESFGTHTITVEKIESLPRLIQKWRQTAS